MRPVPTYLKAVFGALPFASLFLFPWPMTLIAAIAAGLAFPPLAFLAGVLVDIFYFPGEGLPWGTLIGATVALITYAVRHFVKTRIM